MTALAYIFAFLKNAIYGGTIFFVQALNKNGLDTFDILALRFLLSFVILWILKSTKILKINVGIKDAFKKTERHKLIKPLLLTALFSPVIEMLFETIGDNNSSTVTAAAIIALTPIIACVFEEIFLKETTTVMQKIFMAVGIIGVVYIAINTDTKNGTDSLLGIICLVIAAISGPLHLVFSRESTKSFAPFEISYFACLFGTVFFNVINIVKHIFRGDILHYFDPYFDPENIIPFLFLSVFATVVATGMNNFAISKLQSSTIAVFGAVSTVTTILISVIWGNAELLYYHYIGFALIFIRIIGVSYIANKKDKKKT